MADQFYRGLPIAEYDEDYLQLLIRQLIHESDEENRAHFLLENITKRMKGGTGLLGVNERVSFPADYYMVMRQLESLSEMFRDSFPNALADFRLYLEGLSHKATEDNMQTADQKRVWYLYKSPMKPN